MTKQLQTTEDLENTELNLRIGLDLGLAHEAGKFGWDTADANPVRGDNWRMAFFRPPGFLWQFTAYRLDSRRQCKQIFL